MPNVDTLGAELTRGADILAAARSVVVFTGAGISADSGIPTYRSSDDALWATALFERYANPEGYREHLPASYDWYRARAAAARAAEPNPGHRAIAQLAAVIEALSVVTQNVDGLHLRAGSTGVLELHGHLREVRCDGCGHHVPWERAPGQPVCESCGGMLRPCVVMFGEMLEERTLQAARDAAARCDVLISVGTSNLVWPARELPAIAQRAGAWVFVVNTDLWGQPAGDRVLRFGGRAGDVLPALVASVPA